MLGGVELRHLEYFVAVAAERSFTRAAGRLHVVQSAVSSAISALERELGAVLFERSAQRVSLTDAGEALLPRARATLDAAQSARDAVQEVGRELHGTVAVGCLTAVGGIDFAGLLGEFHRVHPRVRLRLRAATWDGSAGLARSLVDGEIDVAFLGIGGRPFPQLRTRELVRIPQVLVVPADHRLAKQDSVTLAEVADEPFIDYPLGYANRTANDQAFRAAGLERVIGMEVTDVGVAAEFATHGLGVTILPTHVVPQARRCKALPVTDQSLEWSLHLATAENRRISSATAALMEMVDSHLARSR
ncbi:DNA-binding transcriptional LysR family regulator [Micromonospora pisi]|uniref:DNA-binding transcriptional LysR family regulator n=1 Tax=Micromonospora pisi TaxID=589240 RepID=A0A495JC84_9ACTN|nr:DNA-binding transcriptional LysR family regulator [Micromonospora pisi]